MHGIRPGLPVSSVSPERDSRTRFCVTGSSRKRLDPVRPKWKRRARSGHAVFFRMGHVLRKAATLVVLLGGLAAAGSLPAKTPTSSSASHVALPDSMLPDSVRVIIVPDSLLDP